ncbi:uncharacterized protein LOC129589634 isoform X2 [Paramacrobiotus metropolitanus]|uniref:uncharacterized protein LOC129589634 isoform X2 n=1 Tax=Paramacrobiotus metropolitanus TaxID=2943436 RepID=UPI002445940C|nr:uncharacterized protein LOC129589634 isoform X2 [Paramacrobiotus metropolitanus]
MEISASRICGPVLGWVPHDSKAYVCVLMGDQHQSAIVNLREKVAVNVLGTKSSRATPNGMRATVYLDAFSKPSSKQYDHIEETLQRWASNIILTPSNNSEMFSMSLYLSALSLKTPTLKELLKKIDKNEGLADILARVERIEQYSHDERISAIISDDTDTLKFTIWPDHRQRFPEYIQEGMIFYLKNVRFKYGTYFATAWNTFVFTDLENTRTQSLKRTFAAGGASAPGTPVKSGAKQNNNENLLTLEDVVEKATGFSPVSVSCQIKEILPDGSGYTYQGCQKCNRRLQVSAEQQFTCYACKVSQALPKHRYKVRVVLTDATPLVEVAAFLDNEVTKSLLGMAPDELFGRSEPEQLALLENALINPRKWFTMCISAPEDLAKGPTKYRVLSAKENATAIVPVEPVPFLVEEVYDVEMSGDTFASAFKMAVIEAEKTVGNIQQVGMAENSSRNAANRQDAQFSENGMPGSSQDYCLTMEFSPSKRKRRNSGDQNRARQPSPEIPYYPRLNEGLRPRNPQIGRNYTDVCESSDDETMSPRKKRSLGRRASALDSDTSDSDNEEKRKLDKLAQQKSFIAGHYTLAKYGSAYYPAVISRVPTARVGHYLVEFLDSGRIEEISERDLLRPSVWLKEHEEVWLFTHSDRSIVRAPEHYESGVLLEQLDRTGQPPLFKVEITRVKKGKGRFKKICRARFRDVAINYDQYLVAINRPTNASIGAEPDLDNSDVDSDYPSETSVLSDEEPANSDLDGGGESDGEIEFINDRPLEDPVPSSCTSSGVATVYSEDSDEESEGEDDQLEENDIAYGNSDEEEDDVVDQPDFKSGDCVFAEWTDQCYHAGVIVTGFDVQEAEDAGNSTEQGNEHENTEYSENLEVEGVADTGESLEDQVEKDANVYNVLFTGESEPRKLHTDCIFPLTEVLKGGREIFYYGGNDKAMIDGTIDKVSGEGSDTKIRIKFKNGKRETYPLEELCFTEEVISKYLRS